MTPDDAAAILGVDAGASLAQIERAYRHQARISHPDLLGTLTPAELSAAEARFVRVTQARDVLTRLAERRAAPPPERVTVPTMGSSIYGNAPAVLVPTSWLFWTWTGLLVLACVLTFIGGPLVMSFPDLLLRLLPLVLLSAAYSLTGRMLFFRGILLFMAATIVITFIYASFGSLLSLMLIIVPVIGLAVLGRRTARLGRIL